MRRDMGMLVLHEVAQTLHCQRSVLPQFISLSHILRSPFYSTLFSAATGNATVWTGVGPCSKKRHLDSARLFPDSKLP